MGRISWCAQAGLTASTTDALQDLAEGQQRLAGLREPKPQQHLQVLLHIDRRTPQLRTLTASRFDHHRRIEIEQVFDKRIGMLSLDTKRCQRAVKNECLTRTRLR